MIPFDITEFQPKAWSILSRSFQSDRIAGTYLLYGRKGSGRWSVALTLAALLNCESPISDRLYPDLLVPCGKCRDCNNVFHLNFAGLIFAVPLPPHKNPGEAIELTNEFLQMKRKEPFALMTYRDNTVIPIEVARQIKRDLATRSQEGITRVVIFHQMEQMRQASADALLKLIEEPPSQTVILLTAEKPELLLPTIQSRALKVRIGTTPPTVLETYLQSRYNLNEKRAALLARISQGNPGVAITMIEKEEDTEDFQRELSLQLFRSVLTESGPQTLSHLVELVGERNRGAAFTLLEHWQSFIRDCTNLALTGDDNTITNVDLLGELQKLERYFVVPQVGIHMTDHIKNTLADLRRNVHIHGALAALALRVKSDVAYN